VSRVLIVEDDVEIRETLSQVLELEGYAVAAASDGRKALASARQVHPDVILLDLMMPVMDGWQFRAEQKNDPSISDIPVVVVSALGWRTDIDAVAFIAKPFRVEQVIEAVERFGHRHYGGHGHAEA
jgi:CheY-like chemotaxis protein